MRALPRTPQLLFQVDAEDTLRFAELTGVRPLIETLDLLCHVADTNTTGLNCLRVDATQVELPAHS